MVLSVPRVYEKMEEKLKEIASSKGPLALSIAAWAKAKGYAKVTNQEEGKEPPSFFSFANFLILNRIK